MLTSLVVLLAVVVALVTVLVIGLLRAYGEVLRRLHEAGIGVEDGDGHAAGLHDAAGHRHDLAATATAGLSPAEEAADIARRLDPSVAPPRSGGADLPPVVDLAGVTPTGDAVAVGLIGGERVTMLAFLSSGCGTCANFWEPLRNGARLQVGDRDVRVVVVTGGPQHERPRAVGALAGPELTVVMSDEAWQHYAVPATPYFVLLDGLHGVLGEGSAMGWDQLVGLMERAVQDRGFDLRSHRPDRDPQTAPYEPRLLDLRDGADRPGGAVAGESGPARAARVDAALTAAGIVPGDPRLFESPLDPGPGGEAATPS
ncbi:MAG: hypothetical protein R2755_15910 [Acidimicrobiales bacterium]